MKKALEKVFGGIELTWSKVIVAAIIAGIYTSIVCIVTALRYTSFHTIGVTFEVWILFGIIIIMNSKSNMDSALKCFVFFLISQPLVYLIQVPFSDMGWGLFVYYKYWFIWTLFSLPMGFIGYYMKQNRWWGYLILFPMILLTASSYRTYLDDFLFFSPRFILICLFCIAAMLIYPIAIFEDKKIRTAGVVISSIIIVFFSVITLMNPVGYSTEILGGGSYGKELDDTYKVYLEDDKYGQVKMMYIESIDSYMVHADFKRAGDTVLILEDSKGEKTEFDLHIEKDTYEITKR